MRDHERQPKLRPQLSKLFHSDLDRKPQALDLQQLFLPNTHWFPETVSTSSSEPRNLGPTNRIAVGGINAFSIDSEMFSFDVFWKTGL